MELYLDVHGLAFETSICYWQDQPGIMYAFWSITCGYVCNVVPHFVLLLQLHSCSCMCWWWVLLFVVLFASHACVLRFLSTTNCGTLQPTCLHVMLWSTTVCGTPLASCLHVAASEYHFLWYSLHRMPACYGFWVPRFVVLFPSNTCICCMCCMYCSTE